MSEERHERIDRQSAAGWMQTAALPVLGSQRTKQRQRFLTPSSERGQRLAGIVPQVLSVLGEPVRRGGVGVDLRVVLARIVWKRMKYTSSMSRR